MPKYLLEVSLSRKGLQGTLKEGGTARKAVSEGLLKSVGGKLEAFYYAFGDRDVIALIDVPDNASAARVATTVTASGAGSVKDNRPLDSQGDGPNWESRYRLPATGRVTPGARSGWVAAGGVGVAEAAGP
jgi:uncharacterized protein with GYD domain